jgi:hypothetical protein
LYLRGSNILEPLTVTIVLKFAIICCFLTLAVAASAQSPAPLSSTTAAARNGLEDVYLAKDNGSGKAGDPATSFFTNDIPIYCIVQLTTPRAATVKMVFVAVSVAGVKAETKVVTTVFTTREDQSRVNFTGKPYDKWTAGKYRVDIFIDGEIVTGVPFDIRPVSGSIDGATSFQPARKAKAPLRPKRN